MELLYAQGYGKRQERQDLQQFWIPKATYQKLPAKSQINSPRQKPQTQMKQMWVPKQLLQAQGYTKNAIKIWLPKTKYKPTLPRNTRIPNPQMVHPEKPKGKQKWVPKAFNSDWQQKQGSSHTKPNTNNELPQASSSTKKRNPILPSTITQKWIPKKQVKHPAITQEGTEQAIPKSLTTVRSSIFKDEGVLRRPSQKWSICRKAFYLLQLLHNDICQQEAVLHFEQCTMQ